MEGGLTLQREREPDITVSGDARQLSQLVEIYLDNARKYASGGTVAVRLSRCGKNRCRLSVSNEGEALSPQALRQIFDRFCRADARRQLWPRSFHRAGHRAGARRQRLGRKRKRRQHLLCRAAGAVRA